MGEQDDEQDFHPEEGQRVRRTKRLHGELPFLGHHEKALHYDTLGNLRSNALEQC